MKFKLLVLTSVLATLLASVFASSACLFAAYQPEEPKCLRD